MKRIRTYVRRSFVLTGTYVRSASVAGTALRTLEGCASVAGRRKVARRARARARPYLRKHAPVVPCVLLVFPPAIFSLRTCVLPTYVRTYVRIRACSLRTYVRAYVRTYVRAYVRTYVRAYVRTYVGTYVRRFRSGAIRASCARSRTHARTHGTVVAIWIQGGVTYVRTLRTYVAYVRTYVRTYVRRILPTYVVRALRALLYVLWRVVRALRTDEK